MWTLDQIYLVAAAAMDYFDKLNAIDCITLSGKKQSDWYIPVSYTHLIHHGPCHELLFIQLQACQHRIKGPHKVPPDVGNVRDLRDDADGDQDVYKRQTQGQWTALSPRTAVT